MKNLGQKCAKCGKTNHMTQDHWPGGKHPQKGKGQLSQKVQILQRTRKHGEGQSKGTRKSQCIDITDLLELSITSSESINFSCYKKSDKVEWFLDSGAQTTSHQEKVILSNIGNLDKHIMLKSQMGNTSELRVMEQLSDTA